MKPFSEACEQNKDPILEILEKHMKDVKTVLEIGSGTGQHCVYFAQKLPHLNWYPSDVAINHAGIKAWIDDTELANVYPPCAIDVNQSAWPIKQTDAVFSANTTHIMDWNSVVNMFKGIAQILSSKGIFILYGPFNYEGKYTSKSNEQFDMWLKSRDPLSGIREFNEINTLANENDMIFIHDYTMPANNRTLVWEKVC